MSIYGNLRTKKPPQETLAEMAETFSKWGVAEWDAPRLSARSEDGPAKVWFVLAGARKEMECSRFTRYRDNLRALYLAVEGIRMASQRGILEQYKQFFQQLPAAGESSYVDPYEVLGIRPDAGMDVAEAAYRALAKTAHPDMGGSDEAMRRLNRAFEALKIERGQ